MALTIAGSDPSGGAGIQADLKTFTVLGVYGASALTALTAQNTLGVTGIFPVPAEFVTQEIEAVVTDLPVRAVKTGMLGTPEVVRAVAAAVERHNLHPLVADPVLAATSGGSLAAEGVIEALLRDLLPVADLVTPNLNEAARLLGTAPAADLDEMEEQAKALARLGARAVLLKGGHGNGETAADFLLLQDGNSETFSLPRLVTRNTHGTGCALSAAVTARLAKGASLAEAVKDAKQFVWTALKNGQEAALGHGTGPILIRAGDCRL